VGSIWYVAKNGFHCINPNSKAISLGGGCWKMMGLNIIGSGRGCWKMIGLNIIGSYNNYIGTVSTVM
jgi:hypothetical protein